MFKLARLTDYAVVLLLEMGRGGRLRSAADLSRATAVPVPTVQKILKELAHGALVESRRGKSGGYSLARMPQSINLADILRIMEGPIALTACVDGVAGNCEVERICGARGRWDMVNRAVKEALSSLTLADMMAAEAAALPFQLPGEATPKTPKTEVKHGG